MTTPSVDYSPIGRGFVTMEVRLCSASGYVMLTHTYDKFILPVTIGSWTQQCRGLTFLLQIRVS